MTMELIDVAAAIESFFRANVTLSYLLLFAGSFLDAIVGVNFVVRGEIFFVAGAALAGAGVLNIFLVTLLALGGSIVGDHTSYLLGKTYGTRLFQKHRFLFNPVNYERGRAFFDKFGAKAVLLARLLGPLTWIMPFIAGMYKAPYRQFLFYNIIGVIAGVGQFIIIGYLFGTNYERIFALSGKYALLVMAVVVVLLVFYFLLRARIVSFLMRMRSLWR